MNSVNTSYRNEQLPSGIPDHDMPVSAVSWGAIFAGAAGAASLSLILLMLGVGLGLSSVSPWMSSGMGMKALGVSTIVWIIFTQLTAAALGGYIAGRMRTRWQNVPVDEVHFRDTAHGFLTWSVATLFTAALLTSTISAVLGGTAATTLSALSSPLSNPVKHGVEDLATGGIRYQLDKLFRTTSTGFDASRTVNPNDAAVPMPTPIRTQRMLDRENKLAIAEVGRIFAHTQSKDAGANTELSKDDLTYVTSLVERQTGLSFSDAENRVINSYAFGLAQAAEFETAAKLIADKTRKSATHASLWLFISLLIGAFIASLSATLGAKHRDD